MTTIVITDAMMLNAVIRSPYFHPRRSDTASPNTVCAMIATCGGLCTGCVRASTRGSTPWGGRAWTGPAWVQRVFAEWRSRFEADERENGEHHPFEDPVVRPSFRVRGVKRLQRQASRIRQDHPERERDEDDDLENADDDAGLGREPDVAVGEEEDDAGRDEDPDPPLPRVVPAQAVLVGGHH